MVGLDTNVLLRLAVGDDLEQRRRVPEFFETATGRGEALFISKVVLCELVWSLRRRYRAGRPLIITILDRLVGSYAFVVEEEPIILEALELYRAGQCDFADGVIGAGNRRAGCSATATFDGKATRSGLFDEL